MAEKNQEKRATSASNRTGQAEEGAAKENGQKSTGRRKAGEQIMTDPQPSKTRAAEGTSTGDGQQKKSRAGGGAKKGAGGDLKKDLREFASARPQGWGHDDWINFLESLQSRGHDVGDRDSIGLALEKERLDLALNGRKGLTASKRKALVERYGTIWNLRNADSEEVAGVAGIERGAADQLRADLQ